MLLVKIHIPLIVHHHPSRPPLHWATFFQWLNMRLSLHWLILQNVTMCNFLCESILRRCTLLLYPTCHLMNMLNVCTQLVSTFHIQYHICWQSIVFRSKCCCLSSIYYHACTYHLNLVCHSLITVWTLKVYHKAKEWKAEWRCLQYGYSTRWVAKTGTRKNTREFATTCF